jgi:folate-binding protein YgfZ
VTSPIRRALLAELPSQSRTIVRVTGDDAVRFLQGLLTADVAELAPGSARAATLLTVKGKIISEVWVLAVDDEECWLAVPDSVADDIITKLDGHIIMDDVQLEPLPEQACAIVWRASAADGRGQASAADGRGQDGARLHARELEPLPAGVRAFEATHPLPGVLLVGPESVLRTTSLGEPADADAFTAARIAHARPAWGFEITPDHFPPEVGFVDAVSYDKGCYLGQEPLSRIHNRGQVNRVMVRVRLSTAPSSVLSNLPIELTADSRPAGQLTSVAGLEGLAIVRRNVAHPGTRLAAGELEVEVVTQPLGDDPGGPSRTTTATVKLGGR